MEDPRDFVRTVRDRDGVLYGAPDQNPNNTHNYTPYVYVAYGAVRYVNLRNLKPNGTPKTLGDFRECHTVARWLTRPGLPDEFMTQRPFYDVPNEVRQDILARFDDINLGRAESGRLYHSMRPNQWTLDERPVEGSLEAHYARGGTYENRPLELRVKGREGF